MQEIPNPTRKIKNAGYKSEIVSTINDSLIPLYKFRISCRKHLGSATS